MREDSEPEIFDENGPIVTDPSVVVPEAEVELADLACQSEYVAGFPMHVALLLAPRPRQARLNRLPLPTLSDWGGAVGVELRRPSDPASPRLPEADTRTSDRGEPPVLAVPASPVGIESGSPRFSLGPDVPRRVMIDLADVMPPNLPEGPYVVSINYASEDRRSEVRSAAITLRRPTTDESRVRGWLAGELEGARSFGAWLDARSAVAAPDPRAAPLDSRPWAGLHYIRTVRYLKFGHFPPDPLVLDNLHPFYAPEAAAWRAELLVARGDSGAKREIEHVRAAHPELNAWMDVLATGTSELQFARRGSGSSP